ncbi:MAG: 3-phosphoshikimate 1-carboxyvinyltransferase [Gemmatimonadota bacterium]
MTKRDMVEISVPGDKSISHRALMLAALATGPSSIRRILDAADVRSTAAVLRELGVEIPALSNNLVMEGKGLRALDVPKDILDCGNSGTTARLMLGIVAGHPMRARFDGDASLRSRPMRRVTEPLARMGARVRELGEPDRLPLEIEGGRLGAIELFNEKSSAQVKSAILLAALVAGVPATVREPVHSRDHTERMLNAMGAELRTIVDPDGTWSIELAPVGALRPIDLDVPGDLSSAAFFLARGLLCGPALRIDDVGVNATRTGFLDVVRRMGGALHVEHRHGSTGEPIATLSAEHSELRGAHIEASEIPHMVDEIPILAVLAARAQGETRIHGAGELRVKETDRLKAIADNLRAVGVTVDEQADGLVIAGRDAPLRGPVVTHGDHRIAMAFGILGSLPGNQIAVDDPECVVVSFPTFWEQLKECTGT